MLPGGVNRFYAPSDNQLRHLRLTLEIKQRLDKLDFKSVYLWCVQNSHLLSRFYIRAPFPEDQALPADDPQHLGRGKLLVFIQV